jgi:hypothetical protein
LRIFQHERFAFLNGNWKVCSRFQIVFHTLNSKIGLICYSLACSVSKANSFPPESDSLFYNRWNMMLNGCLFHENVSFIGANNLLLMNYSKIYLALVESFLRTFALTPSIFTPAWTFYSLKKFWGYFSRFSSLKSMTSSLQIFIVFKNFLEVVLDQIYFLGAVHKKRLSGGAH